MAVVGAIGSHPWTHINDVFDRTKDFEWRPGVTPLSTFRSMIASSAAYLVIVWLLRRSIKKPTKLTRLAPALHNIILCLGSLLMFLGELWEVIQETRLRGNIEWLVCLPPSTKAEGALYFWSYVYYLSKFYELLDTLLLVLKAKPLSFLHVFHHATVIPMAYFWLADVQSVQQIALLTNTFIHILMYYYYFLCTLGRGPNWKRFMTNAQIIQFVFSFAVSVPFWWQHANGKQCSGFRAMVFNAAFNFLLLVLFINFHRKNYAAKRRRLAKQQ